MAKKINGVLRVCPENHRYFTDDSGQAIYLAGSHTWNNFRDRNQGDPPTAFDYPAFLDFQEKFHHNFFRLWAWELPRTYQVEGIVWHCNVFPWPRTGPGLATDGKPRFDLAQLLPGFFMRMRQRVLAAQERGLYVCVMLFDGFGPQILRRSDDGFPLDGANNINGINCGGPESQSLADPSVTAVQEAYVRKVIETVNDLDNVLYEIANEPGVYSTNWQYHFIRFVKQCEATLPKQHPVGMTFQYKGGTNETLFNSPADWISPDGTQGYGHPTDPPAADGRKVIINDTDHSLYYIGLKEVGEAGQRAWVWKNFLRGNNLAFMDPYLLFWPDRNYPQGNNLDPCWDMMRRSLGYTRDFANRIDLTNMKPCNDLASTKYCLANPGKEYLVYVPEGTTVEVDITDATGHLQVEWFNPATGTTKTAGRVTGGEIQKNFNPPFSPDAVLYLVLRCSTRINT